MGVPRFFWWFLNKYPKTLSDAVVDPPRFDNFYIDLNEIIHPCFRPDDDLFPPTHFDEIFWSLYRHIDRLFDLVKPTKLLFIAVDGVASRAKMYLIRSGRFSIAKSNDLRVAIKKKLRKQFEQEGKSLLSKEDLQGVDPTVVTPGTEFMQMLSEKLRSYICRRMTEDSAWGNIKVILSDDKVPGEGEHKIMSFIRAQRASPGYDPNTRHCVYGTDTDLIMLALATHEVHFSILREEPVRDVVKRKVCQFLNVCVLREYLALDLEIPFSDNCEYDLERIIDDFIFICFFAGNDFLPRMPTLQTHEGCIDLLMHVYKKEFQNFGGYLVDMQKAEDGTGRCINFKGVERFILTVGAYEDKIFSKRSQLINRKLRRAPENSGDVKDHEKDHQDDGIVSQMAKYSIVDSVDGVFRNTVELLLIAEYIYNSLKEDPETDKVKFGTHGWRERYYEEKFSAETPEDIEATRNTLVAKYGEGLCWVLLCYFSGVPSWSWSWYYSQHYAPLASDLEGLSQIKVEFQKGLPFKPFDQLMAVLPPRRAYLLPEAYKRLMTDENSKIAYLYHTEPNQKSGKSARQGITHPSMEEDLLSETKKLENELKEHEKVRNLEILDQLFIERSSKASQKVVQYSGPSAASNKIKGAVMINSTIEGIQGVLHLMPEDLSCAYDANERDCSRNVLCMFFETNKDFQHVPKLLEGVNIPQKTVKKEDRVVNILWHESYGSGSVSTSNTYQNRSQPRPEQKSDLDRGIGELKLEEHTSSSLRPNYGSRHQEPSEYKSRSIRGSSRKDGYGGTESRRESDMNLRPMSNNRSRQGDCSFWQSRSGVTYDSNDDWRSKKQSGAAPGGSWHKNSGDSSSRTHRPNESSSSNVGGRW